MIGNSVFRRYYFIMVSISKIFIIVKYAACLGKIDCHENILHVHFSIAFLKPSFLLMSASNVIKTNFYRFIVAVYFFCWWCSL